MDIGLHVDVRPHLAVRALGSAEEAAPSNDGAEDVVLVFPLRPGQGTLLSRAAQATGRDLGNVDLDNGLRRFGIGLGVLGDVEGDGRILDGFADDPADSLL